MDRIIHYPKENPITEDLRQDNITENPTEDPITQDSCEDLIIENCREVIEDPKIEPFRLSTFRRAFKRTHWIKNRFSKKSHSKEELAVESSIETVFFCI